MSSTWKATTLGELCDAFNGVLQTGPFGSQLHAEDYLPNGPVPVVPTSAIGRRRLLDIDLPKVSAQKAEELARHKLREGDILFARRGIQATGLSCLVGAQHEGWLCGTGAILLRLPSDAVDANFLSCLLSDSTTFSWLRQHAIGATMPNLNEDVIRRLPLVLPPLPEQRIIARALSTLDDKIELNRKMNETLEEMARALFKSWFVDFDPVHAKASGKKPYGMDDATAALFPDSFEESELGLIPRGWSVAPLAEISSKIGSGATPTGGSSVYTTDGVAFIRSQNVYDGQFTWDGLARLSDTDARRLSGVAVEYGDVLLNITGDSILRTCVVDPSVLPARVNQHVAIIRPKKVGSRYLYEWLVRTELKNYLLGHSAGATRKAITKAHLEATPVLLPLEAIHDRFLAMANSLGVQEEGNDLESRALSEIRDALLPKLLSGELRIKDAERLVGQVA